MVRTFNAQESLNGVFAMAVIGAVKSGKSFFIQSLIPILEDNDFEIQYIKNKTQLLDVLHRHTDEEDTKKLIIIEDVFANISFDTVRSILKKTEDRNISVILTLQMFPGEFPSGYNEWDIEFMFDYFVLFPNIPIPYPNWLKNKYIKGLSDYHSAVVFDVNKNIPFHYLA